MDLMEKSDEEIINGEWEKGYNDDWPVQRAYALE